MKNKIKCLILIVALLITRSQLYVFSETNNSGSSNNQTNIQGEPAQNGTITLDGQIGEWDPTDDDTPDFDAQDLEVEGKLPREGSYYTISATVPLSMEFTVFPKRQSAFGDFYSPEYTITNNGSKTLEVKIKTFDRNTSTRTSNDEAPLHIEKVTGGDGKTQMELKLSVLANPYTSVKDIDLTKLSTLSDSDKTLYELTANESKNFKFSSERWELPWFESDKKSAMSNFTAGFEFSIKK